MIDSVNMIRMMAVLNCAPEEDAENTTVPGRLLISQEIGCDIWPIL